jgi:hypothetical protein
LGPSEKWQPKLFKLHKLNSLLLNFGNYSRGQKNRTIFFR